MDASWPDDLEEALACLCRSPQVEGVLAIGSLAEGRLFPASDYDLVVVVPSMEPAWYVGVAAIGGRFTDVLYVSAGALRQIGALAAPLPAGHELSPIVRWLERGTLLFDRGGQVGEAQRRVQRQALIQPPSDDAAYGAWFATNYNLAVAARLAAAADPLYQAVADVRMAVYGHADLWFNYFAVRGVAWEGDKAALRYLEERDPGYLALFQRFATTLERTARLACYRLAAARVTEPLGGLWPEGAEATNLRSPPYTWTGLLGAE
jgi:hypothetical protein